MRPYQYAVAALLIFTALQLAFHAPLWIYCFGLGLFLAVMAVGASKIQLNFFLPALNKGAGNKSIALTFDDGPAAYTDSILDILKREGVTAAFFTIGKRAAANAELVKRWDVEGHIVGNHSYNHGFMFDMLPAYRMVQELERTNSTVETIIERKPLLFRPPYGVTNPALARAVKSTCMVAIGWSIRSFDTKAKSVEALTARVCRDLKGGDIILLHDSMEVTSVALTSIIKTARAKGFTFVRLDELLNIQPYA